MKMFCSFPNDLQVFERKIVSVSQNFFFKDISTSQELQWLYVDDLTVLCLVPSFPFHQQQPTVAGWLTFQQFGIDLQSKEWWIH